MTETVAVTKTVSMTETVSVTVTSQTSIKTTIVTSIGTSVQNSGVSFGLSLPFANSVDNWSDSVVGSIGPSVSIGESSLDGSGVVTVVTSVQDSGVSLSLWGSLDGTEHSNHQQDFHDYFFLSSSVTACTIMTSRLPQRLRLTP